jgi:hypothetical protein
LFSNLIIIIIIIIVVVVLVLEFSNQIVKNIFAIFPKIKHLIFKAKLNELILNYIVHLMDLNIYIFFKDKNENIKII